KHIDQSTECLKHNKSSHFGESPKWDSCCNCDACATTPDWLEIERQSPRSKRGADLKPQTTRSSAPRAATTSEPASVDMELKEYLREWRRITAREKGVAAFVVLHDCALIDLCAANPSSLLTLRRVPGFGHQIVESYDREIQHSPTRRSA